MGHKIRLGELDALRGLAALSVVLFHYTTLYNELFGHKEKLLFNFKYGFFGVHLFFIISGFVIYMTISKSKNIKDFTIKRAIRLYPAYIVAATLTFTLTSLYKLDILKVNTKEFLINLTMLQGVLPIGINNVDGAYWSLGIEITFYIICGILLILGFINKPILVSSVSLIIIFLIKSLYVSNLMHPLIGDLGIVNYSNLFIAGILFFKLKENNTKIIHFLIFAALIYQFLFQGWLSGISISAFFLIFYGIVFDKLKFLDKKILSYFGTISYSLYLIHQNIGYVIIDYIEQLGLTNQIFILVPISISIALATVLTFYIEKPIQGFLLNKYKKGKKINYLPKKLFKRSIN